MEILVNNHTYTAADYPIASEPSIFEKKRNGRETLRLTMTAAYADIAADFTAGAAVVLRETDGEGNPIDYDKSEFSLAGDIVDHRDGRITVYMGRPTAEEETIAALERENAELLFEALTGGEY